MRINERLRRLEKRRKSAGQVFIVCSFDDPGHVTDSNGRRMTDEEFRRLHPDATMIKLTWGDEEPAHDKDLTRWLPPKLWTDL